MDKYYKIKVNMGNGVVKWVGSGHGMLYPTAEKFSLFFTDSTIQSLEVREFINTHDCEIITTNDFPKRDWFVYEPE